MTPLLPPQTDVLSSVARKETTQAAPSFAQSIPAKTVLADTKHRAVLASDNRSWSDRVLRSRGYNMPASCVC